jgi:hypothetical protein
LHPTIKELNIQCFIWGNAAISIGAASELYMKERLVAGNVYDYITKLCRQQAEVIQNHDNENVRNIGQGVARHRKYKRLKLGGGHVYDCSGV